MSSRYPPLTAKEVKRGLRKLGFEPRKRKSGTSHEQWVKVINGKIFKVTVDEPKQPFTQDLIKSMASQAGVSKDKFYEACLKK